MNLSRQVPLAFWLATAVAAIAFVSHALGEPHDVTLVAAAVSVCLCVVDWLLNQRE